jgi:molybdopterin-guanine dinucleotide biosynthesis protein B
LVSVIGFKDSGKTSVAVGLVAALERRGRLVMVVKHGHGFDIDTPGTDSWRLRNEGRACRVVLAGPDDLVVMGEWGPAGEPTLEEVVSRFVSDAEIVVVEGYKKAAVPKIEVHRPTAHNEPVYRADGKDAELYLALVTDAVGLELPIPVLDLNAPDLSERLADLVEGALLLP